MRTWTATASRTCGAMPAASFAPFAAALLESDRTKVASSPARKPDSITSSVPVGLVVDDPRWVRRLPWVEPMHRFASPGYLLGAAGLAFVNVVLPVAVVRLAARRRPWRVRTLLVLPFVVAIPFQAFRMFDLLLSPDIHALPVSAQTVFIVATIAGIPIVVFVIIVVRCLVRRRL